MPGNFKAINVLFDNKAERDKMHQKALEAGFDSASSYLKFCGFNARIKVEIGKYPIVENLATLRELYKDGQISHEELLSIKADIMDKDSKPLIEVIKKSELQKRKKRRTKAEIIMEEMKAEENEEDF